MGETPLELWAGPLTLDQNISRRTGRRPTPPASRWRPRPRPLAGPPCRCSALQTVYAPIESDHHCCGPVVHAELGEDVGQAGLDGGLADEERPCDLLVRSSFCHRRQDLELPRAERLDRPGVRVLPMRRDATAAASSDSPRAAACTPRTPPHGRVLRRYKTAPASSPARCRHRGRKWSGQEPGPLGCTARTPGWPPPVDPGHAQVHEHDVGLKHLDFAHRLLPVAGFPHDVEVGMTGQHALHPARTTGWSSTTSARMAGLMAPNRRRSARRSGRHLGHQYCASPGRTLHLQPTPEHRQTRLLARRPRHLGRLGTAGGGKNPAMSHIIGRPNDHLLDVMLGHGADPEQAFIGGSEQGLEEDDGFGGPPAGRQAHRPEL